MSITSAQLTATRDLDREGNAPDSAPSLPALASGGSFEQLSAFLLDNPDAADALDEQLVANGRFSEVHRLAQASDALAADGAGSVLISFGGPDPVSGQTVDEVLAAGVGEGKLDGWYVAHGGDGVPRVYDPSVYPLGTFSPFPPLGSVSPSGVTTVYVNGANTGLEKAVEGAQTLASSSGDKVVLLFNRSNTGDTARPNRGSPANETLEQAIYDAAVSGETLRVSSTSEGAQTTRYALGAVEGRMRSELGYERFAIRDEGQERNRQAIAQTEALLSSLEIVTYGAHEHTFPVDGPKYLHIVNRNDPFALIDPDGSSRAGDGAVIASFSYERGTDAHEFLKAYMPVLRAANGLDFDALYHGSTRAGEVSTTDFR